MIQEFCDIVIKNKENIKESFKVKNPESYDSIVTDLITLIESNYDEYGKIPCKSRITVIDHGDYQGTRLFIIGTSGYQPSTYYSIFVDYGSCSGCDSFEAIISYNSEWIDDSRKVNQQGIEDLYLMMLHMVQSMRQLNNG